jgi:hypothetical protein
MGSVGQLSDPYQQGEDDQLGITISGLPGDLLEPEPPTGPVDASTLRSPGSGEGDDVDGQPDEGMSGESIAYELDEWSEIERQAVTDRLREAGVPHGWEETRLLVAAVDEGVVENILDIVEGEADRGGGEGAEPLDAERDQIAYDVSELDDELLDALVDTLRQAEIAFAWGDEELYVYADDEEAVDAAFDAVQHPDELAAEDDEPSAGAASAELLGDVFVAADRLQHDGEDSDGTASLLAIAVSIDDLDPPYGMGVRDWELVCAGVGDLADLLAADSPDAEKVTAAARDLRATLRPFV